MFPWHPRVVYGATTLDFILVQESEYEVHHKATERHGHNARVIVHRGGS